MTDPKPPATSREDWERQMTNDALTTLDADLTRLREAVANGDLPRRHFMHLAQHALDHTEARLHDLTVVGATLREESQ